MADIRPDGSVALSRLAGTWRLDPDESTVEFRTKAMWLLNVTGSFDVTDGMATVDDGRVTGRLVISAASIDTNNARRDEHLRGEDFLDVERYPDIVFDVSNAHPGDGGRGSIEGVLTIHGVTRAVAVQADVRVDDAGATAVVEAHATVNRAEYGITWSRMGAGLTNSLVIRAMLVRSAEY